MSPITSTCNFIGSYSKLPLVSSPGDMCCVEDKMYIATLASGGWEELGSFAPSLPQEDEADYIGEVLHIKQIFDFF